MPKIKKITVIKGSICQKDTTVLIVYDPNNRIIMEQIDVIKKRNR